MKAKKATPDAAAAPRTCKMNVVKVNGSSDPECTACGHRFDTDVFANPYEAMCRIARGEYAFCPACGAKYTGCMIEGVDFDDAPADLRDWILRGDR